MPVLTGSIVKYPARAAFLWYVALIAVGTIVLAQPICHGGTGSPVSVVDAAFTSTSAACVTGLVVRSTGHDFSWIGQLVILAIIQVGGIGIMTVTTYAMFQLGGRQSLRSRAVVSETLGADANSDLRWILRQVILITVGVEGTGFAILAVRNLFDHHPAAALWHACFHSVSAFCNAGFALHDDSLSRFRGDPLVNLVICTQIIVGGIGFPVLLDIKRNWHGRWSDRWSRLLLHTKLMVIGTTVLLTLGSVSFLLLEWDGVLHSMSVGKCCLVAMFHSVSTRTAGFNTVEMASLTNAMLFISILLMMVGAGPCSTAGGFKVSTIVVLILQAWNTFRGRMRLNVFRRTVPSDTIQRAMATAMLFGVVAIVALTALLVIEQSEEPHPRSEGVFLDAAFEVVSALGTVGLSTGLTTQLSTASRWILIGAMLLGRLGPISVFVALSRVEGKEPVEYAGESPMIG